MRQQHEAAEQQGEGERVPQVRDEARTANREGRVMQGHG